jgi:CRP-like cAMP-binding protein
MAGQMELIEGLTAAQTQQVISACRRHRFARREVIFHEGDQANAVHMIVSGHVGIRLGTPGGDAVTIDVMGPGRIFGELALLGSPSTRTATAIALDPTETRSLSASAFTTLRHQHPEVTDALFAILLRRFRRQDDLLTEALYVPVDQRLLRRLADLAEIYSDGPPPVTIPLTHNDLAGLTGTTRESVTRLLRRLATRGTVALARGRIILLDPDEIRRQAH